MAPHDMPRIDLDPQVAERLIEGRAGGQLPPGAPQVAAVLEAVRRAATEGDDSRMAATVASMRAALGATDEPASSPARVRRDWRRVPTPIPRIVAASAAGLAVLFGGLAAAGALPAAAQKPVADLASHVGIELPRPAGDSNEKPAVAPTTTTSSTSTTLVNGDTTTTTPTSDTTTVTAPACPSPSYEGPNGCITPLPIPTPPTTAAPPTTTTTTQPPPPPTTTTSTSVPDSGGGGHHGDTP